MQFRNLGKSGLKVSAIIMGTFQAGREKWTGIDDGQSTNAIRAAFDAGINTFDSAEAYGKGHAERILGAAVSDVRDKVVLATKVSPNRLGYHQVLNACHGSLRRLRTDYIDLYQIHWPSGSFGGKVVPVEETMAAMIRLKEQGKVRAIGVSNFSKCQLEEAVEFGPVESIQPAFSLFWRHAVNDAMSFCDEHGISILAYSPMTQGFLTGKFGSDHVFMKGDHRSKNKLYQPKNFRRVQKALTRLRPIANGLGVSLAELALAWVISHTGTCAIAGARSAEQATLNSRAAEVSLSAGTLAQMDEIGRLVTDYLNEDPVMWQV